MDRYIIKKLGFDFGINNISCVTKVTLRFSNQGCSEENEVAIRKAVSRHCNRPALENGNDKEKGSKLKRPEENLYGLMIKLKTLLNFQ